MEDESEVKEDAFEAATDAVHEEVCEDIIEAVSGMSASGLASWSALDVALVRIAFFITIDSFVDGAQKPLEVAEEAEDEEFEEDTLEAVAVAKDDDDESGLAAELAFPPAIAILAERATGLASLAAGARPTLDDGATREPLEAAAEVEDEELKRW